MDNHPINYLDPDGNFKTKFGAWLYRLFNGGEDILKDKNNGEYFVTQHLEDTDGDYEADVILKRTYKWEERGRNKNPYTTKGGVIFTLTDGQSQENHRSTNPDGESVNIDFILALKPVAGPRPIGSSSNMLGPANAIKLGAEWASNLKEITSDLEIKQSSTGTGPELDGGGRSVSRWSNETGDSIPSTVKKTWLNKDGKFTYYRNGERFEAELGDTLSWDKVKEEGFIIK